MNQLKIDFLWNHPVYKEYGCDENGNVYSFMFGKIKKLKPANDRGGYSLFCVFKDRVCKTYSVHRFVWECIMGEIPDGYEVDHRNFVRNDNRIENLRIISLKENRARISDYGRKIRAEAIAKSNKQRCSKPVLQYDKQGNFIAEYPSVREAARQNGTSKSSISSCCLGKKRYKTAHGFIWKYKYV